jgi:hypothetical protein
LVVALCLLAASVAPPAAGAEQASQPASLSLAFDRPAAQVGEHLHLTATLSSQSQDPVFGTIANLALSPGLRLLGADPVSASLGTWSVPRLDPAGSETLALIVEVTAPGTQAASVDLTEGNPFFSGNASATVTARDDPAPVISKLSMKRSRFHFALSEPATVSIAIQHTADRHTRFVERKLGGGAHSLRVTLAHGKYRATFVPTDEQGNQGRARRVSFRV